MFPAVCAALGKAGMASNLQGGIRDAPVLDGGAGALSLFHYQGTSRIALLLDHCMRKNPHWATTPDLYRRLGFRNWNVWFTLGQTVQHMEKMDFITFLDLPCLLVH